MAECFKCGEPFTPKATQSIKANANSAAFDDSYCSQECYDSDMAYFENAGFAFDETFPEAIKEDSSEKSSSLKTTMFNIYTGKGE